MSRLRTKNNRKGTGCRCKLFNRSASSPDKARLILIDPFWSPDNEAYVRSLSAETDYRIIEGVGHFLMLEKPEQFNATLTDMLRKFDLIEK